MGLAAFIEGFFMRIPDWTPTACPQPTELVSAIKTRRGGELINLDKALLWSEPLARGWNVYLKAVRTELGASRQLRELAICTVALLTGAAYEYHHHAPDYLAAGGSQANLDALQTAIQHYFEEKLANVIAIPSYSAIENAVFQYAAQMTIHVKVSDNAFAQMQAHFGTTELVEITAAIASYNMVARFLVALGVSPEH
jgi:alkylhydroperoxidase family enzyme